MKTWEMLGRYAEDPAVRVEAETAEGAVELALEERLRISPGYGPGGSLVPTEVPHDVLHEDFHVGCPECLTEAWDGGAGFFVRTQLPGATLRRHARPEPDVAAGDVLFGGEVLFTLAYHSGAGEPLRLPDGAIEAVERLRARLMEDLEDACDRFGNWSKEAGDARYRLQRVEAWDLGKVGA